MKCATWKWSRRKQKLETAKAALDQKYQTELEKLGIEMETENAQ